jgi:DNA replication and repair protein RecF
MRLSTLRISRLRNISDLELSLEPGFSVFVGPNGAGKTSILEGAYLLSHAQSFRGGSTEHLVQSGAAEFVLHAHVERNSGPIQLGLARKAGDWEGRINNSRVASLSLVLGEIAVACLEPGSHALISGASSERRRFLDWGVFHVEPDYLSQMRRFRRVLRQRNILLKATANVRELDVWDEQLAEVAEPIAKSRLSYFDRYTNELAATLQIFLPELGPAEIRMNKGWAENSSLIDVLRQARNKDMARGHTSHGPHRADWDIRFLKAPSREYLSRGQEKLCAMGCVLAQAQLYAAEKGEWPVIALDDLPSELDAHHQQIAANLLAAAGAQVLVSGLEPPTFLNQLNAPIRVFHVEHGRVRGLL